MCILFIKNAECYTEEDSGQTNFEFVHNLNRKDPG